MQGDETLESPDWTEEAGVDPIGYTEKGKGLIGWESRQWPGQGQCTIVKSGARSSVCRKGRLGA